MGTGVHSTAALPWYPSIQMQTMVLTGRVSSTVHLAFLPQGSATLQGWVQFPLMQASWLEHSESERQPCSVLTQRVPLLPSKPGGHLQSTWCPTTVHSPGVTQGFWMVQGEIQWLLMQALSLGQSLSDLQSTSVQVT